MTHENEFKYYMLKRKGDQTYPLLRIADEDEDEEGYAVKVYLEINTPRPRKDDNTYVALDKEKSDYEKGTREWNYMISKVVLDREVLSKIPMNRRLGFRLKEAPGYNLFHHSVIEKIAALNPTGVYFQDVEEYDF